MRLKYGVLYSLSDERKQPLRDGHSVEKVRLERDVDLIPERRAIVPAAQRTTTKKREDYHRRVGYFLRTWVRHNSTTEPAARWTKPQVKGKETRESASYLLRLPECRALLPVGRPLHLLDHLRDPLRHISQTYSAPVSR